MEAETKSCQNCQRDFVIEPEDFNFYEKIKVPAPTWCPECRMIRRFSIHNTWNLFWRKCDKCGVKVLSVYEPETKITVYCQPCWWGDSWDGTEYAMDYDPSRPFLDQVKELSDRTPYASLQSGYLTLKNSDYSNDLAWSKDCYLVFWADYCDTVFYSSLLNGLKYSLDCIRGWDSELCYESIGFINNYRVFFSDECDACIDVWFSRNCYGCTNCVGCVNLRGASNCIFNIKYSKEEYEKKLKELGFDLWENLNKFEKESHDFWLTKPYREYHGHTMNLNVTGEYTFHSKNSKEGYVVNYAENSKWCQLLTVESTKNCYDYSGWGNNAELIYESVTVGENVNSIFFSYLCWPDCLNLQYCSWNVAGKNNLGCFNLKRKKYCILNKQYSKEEYEKLKDEIIVDMKKNPYVDKLGRKYFYGEFFPSEFSKFSYNKSNAMRFFPKTKEQAIREGFNWSERENIIYNISKKVDSIPERIADTGEEILNEIIGCENCGNGYRIVRGELALLRKMNLPIPHECPKCRENKRFERLTKPKLYHRNCMKCDVNIYTPYSSESPNIVYCVKCYQQEFA
jgi:hypothetical protein